jgi:hypothetical protein
VKTHHNLFEAVGHPGALRWSGDSSEASNSTPTMNNQAQGPSTTPSVRSPSGDAEAETGEDPDRFQCDGCGETFQDDFEALSLYECAECGTRFTRDTSANNNHQCPDCNKFAGKVSDCGCPECNEGELFELEAEKEAGAPGTRTT